ncbi:hypothetical protein B0H13DRAFT_1862509 [Mycena leptocephala]|nr:hypothetical protein B0H13DRAFT_1862509 [Mycena leptocephala]
MPIVHYRPRVEDAVAPAAPITTAARPTTKVAPTTKVKTSTRVIVSETAKATATTKVVVPATTTTVPVTPSVIHSTTLLPTATSIITSSISTTQLTSSLKTTLSTSVAPTKTIAAKVSSVALISPSVSSSASASTSSSTSFPAVAAGIIGSVVGVMLTGLLVAFFFLKANVSQRRWNRRRSRVQSINFDAKNFRRSAIMLENSYTPRAPEFSSSTSIRSVPMDHRTTMHAHHQYSYMHPPPSAYTPDTPSYGTPEYAISPNPFYAGPVQQGYPPEMHRQGSYTNGGHPGVVPPPPPHYNYENNEDAYGGM